MSVASRRKSWTVAHRQWQGARLYQEDDFAVLEATFAGCGDSPGLLMVLADGMGGEAGGAQASRAVVESFLHTFQASDGVASLRFELCLEKAGRRLRELIEDDPILEGMGSTVVAVYYDGAELTWLSVGDSPMWLFSEGELLRLNEDHSMAQVLDRMAESGELSLEEARSDKRRNMLLSAVTDTQAELVDCAKRSCRLTGQDCLLIASDGIQTLSEAEIKGQLSEADGTAELMADALFSAVRAKSGTGQDNMTFLLLFGETGENATVTTQVEEETEVRAVKFWLEAGRRGIMPVWKRLGLGLAIGLLVAAISLWWFD